MESKDKLRGLLCLVLTLLTLQNVTSAMNLASICYEKLDTFLSNQYSSVYHIEVDLYKNDGSLLFSDYPSMMKSTNGKTTETIVGSSVSGYREGRGAYVQFNSISGFKQINSTHVAIVDIGNSCIRMLNRHTRTTSHLAGVCRSAGFIDGKYGKLNYPWGIEINHNNPIQLLITDFHNKALRSMDLNSGELTTVVSSSLQDPRGLSWSADKKSLFITNPNYITEVKFDINSKVISIVILAGSLTRGTTEGAFKSARFFDLQDIAPISKNLNIVADLNRVRILDTLTNRTVPVCLSSSTTCNSLSVRAYSVLVVGTDVYIGSSARIYRLSGYSCSAENITAYLPADKDIVEVKISEDYSAELSVGTHKFKNLQNDECGSFFVNIEASKESGTCADCRRQPNSQAMISCTDDTLSVIWPTDRTFSANETVNAAQLQATLSERAQKEKLVFQLVIVNQVPPVVRPKTIEVVLTEFCAGDMIYMQDSQTCQ